MSICSYIKFPMFVCPSFLFSSFIYKQGACGEEVAFVHNRFVYLLSRTSYTISNNNNNNNNNMTLFNEGNIIYWLPSSLQYGPP